MNQVEIRIEIAFGLEKRRMCQPNGHRLNNEKKTFISTEAATRAALVGNE